MNRALIVPLAAVALTLTACGDDDPTDATTPEATTGATEGAATGTETAVDVPDVIGATVDDATTTLEDAGMTLRVTRRDGVDLPATMDLVDNRVNVAVETGDDGTETVTEVISVG